MKHSSSIKISKEIAKTLGLNQAVLLEIIQSIILLRKINEVSLKDILSETPFWEQRKVQKNIESLVSKGILKELNNKHTFKLGSYDQKFQDSFPGTYSKFKGNEETNIEQRWKPKPETIVQAKEYGIPDEFTYSQLKEFIHFYKEKGEQNRSWDLKFLRYVIKEWRKREIEVNKASKRKPINKDWLPDGEALEILYKSGVTKEFIENEIPEFTLYWQDKGEVSDTWNSRFISHIRRQWARSQNLINNSDLPTPMNKEWLPSKDFYEVLSLSEVDKEFADSCIKEFILYWQETGQSHNSWNSKFFRHVKFQWERGSKNSERNLNKIIEANWSTYQPKIFTKDNQNKQSKKKVNSKLKQLKDKYNF